MIVDIKKIYKEIVIAYIRKDLRYPWGASDVKRSTSSDIIENPNKFEEYCQDFDIILRGTPIIENFTTIYAGRSILTNNSNVDQKMRTDSYIHQESFTTSTKTTHGFNIGVKTSTKLKLNFLLGEAETTIDFTANYNYSNEQVQSSTVTKTITIPSQEIIVPANSQIEVVAYFNKGTAKGKVDLISNIVGQDKCTATSNLAPGGKYSKIIPLGNLVKDNDYIINNKINYVKTNEKDINGMLLLGEGDYSCDASNQFRVSITQIKNNRKVGEEKILDVTPIIEEV
ncbi:ETX/MTX2 family pore-forming toxin [Clostridium perfringens]|nr:ETX/MTX2 family pore-forming toxin [Clostridium perfringens]